MLFATIARVNRSSRNAGMLFAIGALQRILRLERDGLVEFEYRGALIAVNASPSQTAWKICCRQELPKWILIRNSTYISNVVLLSESLPLKKTPRKGATMTAFSYPGTGALYETMADGQPFPQGSQTSPFDDAHELMQRIKAGDVDARQKLITGNLRHVLHSNRRYASSRTGIFDLLKAGNLGLVHALDNFEAEGDGSFSEYAAMCIRQHIERTLNPDQRPAERPTQSPDRHRGRLARHPAAAHSTPGSCQN